MELEQGCPLRRNLQAAGLATPTEPDQCEHALVIHLAVVVHLDPKVLPGAQDLTPARRHRCQPTPAPWLGTSHHHALDLGVCPVGVAEVAAFHWRVDRAHQLNVRRIRHGAIGSSSLSVTPNVCSASSLFA